MNGSLGTVIVLNSSIALLSLSISKIRTASLGVIFGTKLSKCSFKFEMKAEKRFRTFSPKDCGVLQVSCDGIRVASVSVSESIKFE